MSLIVNHLRTINLKIFIRQDKKSIEIIFKWDYGNACRLAKDIIIPQTRISEINKGNRRINADIALRVSKYFEIMSKFWLDFWMTMIPGCFKFETLADPSGIEHSE